ncbi:MAG: TIGR03936 family radical SAM-associated protein [Gemmataceae bacterium]
MGYCGRRGQTTPGPAFARSAGPVCPHAMTGEKIRFRFRKADALRLISHLDTMRCFERMLRRASIPFKSSAGFNPKPRLVLALSLPLGVVGDCEVAELELTEAHDVNDITNRLAAVAPPGMTFLSAKAVPLNATAVARRSVYRVAVPPGRIETVREAARRLMASEKVWAERIKPKPRGLNIRPYLREIRVSDDAVEFDLWVTHTGTARIDELIAFVGLADQAGDMNRIELELADELTGDAGDQPPTAPAETRPPAASTVNAAQRDKTSIEPTWGLSPNGPIVE